ncbi:ubiquitin-related modifier 1 homolog 2 [Dioscorea cayenensis subsp. rotundata]|uniref:Ubiquitin-related modifier 1 homolog n=1 Tax=Dioscorea cayennensis subsp. rotundata TaxID=55577 RepID=A0AB40BIT4_DIOCR|nr:ubiquitin-related modifier 1 homolog 2 [Dioscorea cayenensis subsp. rotundata]
MPSSREPTHTHSQKLGFCFSAFDQRISSASRPFGESELLIMQLTLEFGGGLELLCESIKIHEVDVNPKSGEDKLIMRDLLGWIKANIIKERPEMFMKGDSVRPGVLVLVNDCDWELSGNLDTSLEEKDVVVFISTLHGG